MMRHLPDDTSLHRYLNSEKDYFFMENDIAQNYDAYGYHDRLDFQFRLCDIASMTRDMHTWSKALCALYRELSPWAKDKPAFEDLPKLHEEVYKSGLLYIPVAPGRPVPNISFEKYQLFHNFEVKLRVLHKAAGLLNRSRADPMTALGR
jgi:hypothetical protein